MTANDWAALAGLCAMGAACIAEWKARRLPNWISLPAMTGIAIWRVITGGPPEWLVTFVVLWGFFFWCWHRGLIGGGDAKGLMVLGALWSTWQQSLGYLAWWGATTLVVSLVVELLRRKWRLSQWRTRLAAVIEHTSSRTIAKEDVLIIPSVIGAAAYFAGWMAARQLGK